MFHHQENKIERNEKEKKRKLNLYCIKNRKQESSIFPHELKT